MSPHDVWVLVRPWITVGLVLLIAGFRLRGVVRRWRAIPARAAAARAVAAREGRPMMESLGPWRRIGRGALIGLAFPGCFAILILIMYLTGGRYQTDHRGTTDTLFLLIAYPLGAAIMGAVIGFGSPLMRNALSALLIGMLAMTPFILGIVLSMDNALTHWTMSQTIVSTGMIAIFGSALGLSVLRRKPQDTTASEA